MTRSPGTRMIINDVLNDFAKQGYSVKSVAYDSGVTKVYEDNGVVAHVPPQKVQMSIVLVRDELMRDAKTIAMQDDDE